jgi:hypothetical protein
VVEFPAGITEEMTPVEALAFAVAFLDRSPDDDTLCMAALTIGEPLIDWHWEAIEEAFVALLTERADLRKMVSCCDFDDSVPERVRQRIYSHIRPEDQIGRDVGNEDDTVGRAFVYYGVYGFAAVICAVAAWRTSGVVSIVLSVIAVVLALVTAWSVLFVGDLTMLIRWARRAAGER